MPEVQGTYDSPELTLEDEGKSRIRVGFDEGWTVIRSARPGEQFRQYLVLDDADRIRLGNFLLKGE